MCVSDYGASFQHRIKHRIIVSPEWWGGVRAADANATTQWGVEVLKSETPVGVRSVAGWIMITKRNHHPHRDDAVSVVVIVMMNCVPATLMLLGARALGGWCLVPTILIPFSPICSQPAFGLVGLDQPLGLDAQQQHQHQQRAFDAVTIPPHQGRCLYRRALSTLE